ncbi:MAG: CocE/NonD family hydrolase [Acidobacteriota bacterium]|nr:CocE/NonD family hydrolase [Acidobacteriota bacterium]
MRLTHHPIARYQVAFATLFALTLSAQTPTPAGRTMLREVDVAVPMRDGVVLRADVLRPPAQGRFPTLVYRTPYGKHAALDDETTFSRAVERGYAVVVQDVRGRYRSDGEFRPYENEGRDGFDTIEWAARQPWSDGNVGTFGLSYPGAVQWLAAVEAPPHLKAMVPAMTFSTPQNFFYTWGVWDMSWAYWIWQNIAPDVRVRRNLPGPRTSADARAGWPAVERKLTGTLPLDRLEEFREVAPYYFDWLHHPPDDPFWNFAELRGKYSRTQAAVLNLSGWHDDNYGPEGATTNFTGLVRARGGQPSGTALLIGPWVHGVDATARTKSGEREFGPAAAIAYDEVVLDWMDRHLRGDRPETPPDPAVRYFVMGDNRWKTASAWPPPARSRVYYLSPSPGAAPRLGTLRSEPPTDAKTPSEFIADPDAPVTNPYDGAGAHDYRRLTDRSDVLTFDSPPLDRDTEVTGPILARIYLSCDCRDTDLWVRVLDVAPDGTAYNLMSPGLDVVRASYRDLEKGRQLLEPGQVYELRLDHLVTSNLFKRGHRVRAQISASFFPNFSRNLHTGDLETVSSRRQRATIRVHHDGAHLSQVVLPVVDR